MNRRNLDTPFVCSATEVEYVRRMHELLHIDISFEKDMLK